MSGDREIGAAWSASPAGRVARWAGRSVSVPRWWALLALAAFVGGAVRIVGVAAELLARAIS